MLHRYSGKPAESPPLLVTSLRLLLFSRWEALRIPNSLQGHLTVTPTHRCEAFSLTVTVPLNQITFQSANLHVRQMHTDAPRRGFLARLFWRTQSLGWCFIRIMLPRLWNPFSFQKSNDVIKLQTLIASLPGPEVTHRNCSRPFEKHLKAASPPNAVC